MVGLIAQI